MNKKNFAFFILILGFFQVSILGNLGQSTVLPNVFVLSIAWLYFSKHKTEAFYTAVVGGLILDFFSSSFIGYNVLILTLLFLCVHFLNKYIFPPDAMFAAILLYFLVSVGAFMLFDSLIYFAFGQLGLVGTEDKYSINFFRILKIFGVNFILLYPLIRFSEWILSKNNKIPRLSMKF